MGEVHPFEIRPEEVDKVYELVLKFKRRYEKAYPDPKSPTRIYYVRECEKIKAAYKSGNLKTFKYAVNGLLIAIVCD